VKESLQVHPCNRSLNNQPAPQPQHLSAGAQPKTRPFMFTTSRLQQHVDAMCATSFKDCRRSTWMKMWSRQVWQRCWQGFSCT